MDRLICGTKNCRFLQFAQSVAEPDTMRVEANKVTDENDNCNLCVSLCVNQSVLIRLLNANEQRYAN